MNLFYKPSLSELASLIDQATTDNTYKYNVIVDFDGEVLIDPHDSLPGRELNKFKFYFKEINEIDRMEQRSAKYLKFLNQLFKNLIFCWEKGMNGKVDFRLISKIQERIQSKELIELREKNYPIRVLELI